MNYGSLTQKSRNNSPLKDELPFINTPDVKKSFHNSYLPQIKQQKGIIHLKNEETEQLSNFYNTTDNAPKENDEESLLSLKKKMIKEIRKPTGSSNYKPNDIHALLYQQNDLLQRIKSISQKQKNPISHASEHYEHKIRMLQQRHLAKSEIIDLEKQIEEMEKLKHINSEKPQSYMGSYFNNSLPPPPNAFVKMFWDASQPQ